MNEEKQSKVVLYIAMSLDGYIAQPDGSVEWLYDVKGDGGDNGYAAFYNTIGTLIMGRLTYEIVLQLSEEFLYKGKPCYITTRNPSQYENAPDLFFTDEPMSELVPRLKETSKGDIWLAGGGQMVQVFLQEGLLDEAVIAVIPKVLGEGIPLFPEGTVPSSFELSRVEQLGDIALLYYSKHTSS